MELRMEDGMRMRMMLMIADGVVDGDADDVANTIVDVDDVEDKFPLSLQQGFQVAF